MILPEKRDPRFITRRRGGLLSDDDHRLLAAWAALCAERALHFFEEERPGDERPRKAIEAARAWCRGDISVTESKTAAYHANAAARGLPDRAKYAAYSAGQAAAVAHVAAHELGAAAYAIRAAMAAAGEREKDRAAGEERDWQRDSLPEEIRALVLEDQEKRNDICWKVFG